MTDPGDDLSTVPQNGVLRISDRCRVWMDDMNTGHVRVIKRINFGIIISVIRQIVEIQRKRSDGREIIHIYIPRSLRTIHSDNFQSFIDFADDCCNITIEVFETEEL
jgi:hypothetical protein